MPDAQALTAAVGGLKIHADAFDRACVPCRKQKRKCDKLLPKCSLCKRYGCSFGMHNTHLLPVWAACIDSP